MANANGVHHGSCHCGKVTYQIRLTFPPIHEMNAKSIRIYKCNCTTCQKAGIFHVRPISPGDDFILTSSSPSELGDYRVYKKRIGWYFCKDCGVRVFGAGGSWKEEEIDVESWAGKESKGEVKKVWKLGPGPDIQREVDGKTIPIPLHYLSVNAITLDQGEGGVDLREWHDKGWVFYVENLVSESGSQMQIGKPYDGGMY